MKRVLSVLILFSPVFVFAQDSSQSVVTDHNILYRKEASGGVLIHSNGWGFVFKSGRQVTSSRKRIINIDLVSMKHPKEAKVTNPALIENAKPFIFGKLNYVYFLRAGIGFQNILFNKAEKGGVEVRYNYYGGFTLGIAKPVYLDVLEDDTTNDDPSVKIIVTKRYDPNDRDQQTVTGIYGKGPFFKGFSETKLHPGIHLKTSLSFEYSGWQKKIAALETGITADYFPDKIPIMAFNKAENFYFNFFISVMWGGKW